MRAVVFDRPGRALSVETRPDPTPDEGKVVVKVSRCGICGSDLHMAEGHGFTPPTGTIFGHEFSGEVIELGKNAEGVSVGDRISVMPIFGCGKCISCQQGLPADCVERQFTSGGYGEYVAIDPTSAILLPSIISLEDGALAEPLAVALHGIMAAGIEPGDVVTVIGAGPIGLASLFWARRFGASRVYVVEKIPARRDIALAMGASAVFEPLPATTGESYNRYNGQCAVPELADLVLECVGRSGMIMPAAAHAKRRGKLVSLGYCFADDTVIPAGLGSRELRLFFPQLYTRREFEAAINALDSGAVEARHMVTQTVGLDAVPATFEALRSSPRQCKVLIAPFEGTEP